MTNLQKNLTNYLEYCKYQKRLDSKTLKAYRIDLTQFISQLPVNNILEITSDILENFIAQLRQI